MFEKFREIKIHNEEEMLIDVHHVFCREYGFVSLEELKKLPVPTVLNLLERIRLDNNAMNRAMRKMK